VRSSSSSAPMTPPMTEGKIFGCRGADAEEEEEEGLNSLETTNSASLNVTSLYVTTHDKTRKGGDK